MVDQLLGAKSKTSQVSQTNEEPIVKRDTAPVIHWGKMSSKVRGGTHPSIEVFDVFSRKPVNRVSVYSKKGNSHKRKCTVYSIEEKITSD